MKKILVVFLFMIMLVGCSNNDVQTIFVKDISGKYGLYSIDGEQETEFIYDDFVEVENMGYIVMKDNKYAYLSNLGKELIKLGQYKELKLYQSMIVGIDNKDKITIFDNHGKELYKEDNKTKINIEDAVIIKKDKEYLVLSKKGDVIVTSKELVSYASIYDDNHALIGYKELLMIKDTSLSETEDIVIKTTDKFEISAYDAKQGYLLYSKDKHILKLVSNTSKEVFSIEKEADKVEFDGNNNILLTLNNKLTLISNDGSKQVAINSYYQNIDNYVEKNEKLIYGPHKFYSKGKENVLNDVQLDPLGSIVKENIFPVYYRQQGYEYYNFSGEKAIEEVFKIAGAFDHNNRAIVSKKEEKYYLINKSGKKVSDEYVSIELIGEGYYAAYITASKYEVINLDGKAIIDSTFMGNHKEIFTYQGVVYGLFERSGKSYVYDIINNSIVFEYEGELIFNQDGYYIGNQKVYLSMKGKEIYSR